MRVNLHATYRLATGLKLVQLDWVEGLDVEAALRELVVRCPRLRSELYTAEDTLSDHVHIFVNRRDVTHAAEGRPILLAADDVIDLFPPISGGTQ
jgi:sulfur-carrier protein